MQGVVHRHASRHDAHPWRIVGWVVLSYLASTASAAAQSLPDFMEHWEFGIDVDEDQGPSYFADLIVPLLPLRDDDHVAFFEPRLSYTNDEQLYNFGWGYRRLVANGTWLLGGNMFYDYGAERDHYRLGWGLEVLGAAAEFRANYYLGLSSARLIEDSATTQTFEKAVDGFDLEAGFPVPYYSRMKLFGGFNWYNFTASNFHNRYGWTLRAEYTPWPFLVIDGRVDNDTKSNLDWGMKVAFRLPFGDHQPLPIRSPLSLDETMVPSGDATNKRWVLVERHHDIVVETERKTASVSIEVRRNN